MGEYSVPIMFDVTAPDRETAGKALVQILTSKWTGQERYRPGGDTWQRPRMGVQVESWWTIEAQDKKHDRNDNDPGRVVFTANEPTVSLTPDQWSAINCFGTVEALDDDGNRVTVRLVDERG